MASPRPPSDLANLSRPKLEALAEDLLAEVADLRQTVAALRDEIAHLKGLKGRPSFKPSGMEQATESTSTPLTDTAPRRKGGKTARLTIHEDRVIPASVPAGSRFKGYESFVVQDLVLRAHVIRFRRERWVTPDGVTVVAPLPPEVRGHFGAQRRATQAISAGPVLSGTGDDPAPTDAVARSRLAGLQAAARAPPEQR